MIREAITAGRSAAELTSADLDAAAQAAIGQPLQLSDPMFAQAFDPVAAIAARTEIGGAAPEPFEAMVAECRAALTRHSTWYKETTARMVTSETALLNRARALAETTSNLV
jgi:argininosuccinate lyase